MMKFSTIRDICRLNSARSKPLIVGVAIEAGEL
jgi:hypothetical protein